MSRPKSPRGIDLIRDGVPPAELRRGGTRAVWGALVSTAMSWQNRGWDFEMWLGALSQPNSTLGVQMRLDSRRRPKTALSVRKDVDKAWKRAEEFLADRPETLGRDDIAAWANDLLEGLDALADDLWPLGDRERIVLRHVLTAGAQIGTTSPVAPVRAVQNATGLPHLMAVSRALKRLVEADLLRLESRGRRRRRGPDGRPDPRDQPDASRYAWTTQGLAALLRTSNQCPFGAIRNAPPANVPDIRNSHSEPDSNTTSIDIRNTPDDPEPQEIEMNADTEMATDRITIRLQDGQIATVEIPATVAAREQVLDLLRASGADVPDTDRITDDPNVVPLRRAGAAQ